MREMKITRRMMMTTIRIQGQRPRLTPQRQPLAQGFRPIHLKPLRVLFQFKVAGSQPQKKTSLYSQSTFLTQALGWRNRSLI